MERTPTAFKAHMFRCVYTHARPLYQTLLSCTTKINNIRSTKRSRDMSLFARSCAAVLDQPIQRASGSDATYTYTRPLCLKGRRFPNFGSVYRSWRETGTGKLTGNWKNRVYRIAGVIKQFHNRYVFF